jgi:hypothetical protein
MGYKIITEGLSQMIRDFERLAGPEPIERGKQALNDALHAAFAATQAAVPTDDGDYRRPAGALRDSGRVRSEWDGEQWAGEVTFGTEDDRMPYAVWARWKHLHKTGDDYMAPMDDAAPEFERAMNEPFDDVWNT